MTGPRDLTGLIARTAGQTDRDRRRGHLFAPPAPTLGVFRQGQVDFEGADLTAGEVETSLVLPEGRWDVHMIHDASSDTSDLAGSIRCKIEHFDLKYHGGPVVFDEALGTAADVKAQGTYSNPAFGIYPNQTIYFTGAMSFTGTPTSRRIFWWMHRLS